MNELWEREKGKIISESLKKKNKKSSALLKKLNMMDDAIKYGMIDAYLLRCKLLY